MAANYLPSIDAILIVPTAAQGTSAIATPRTVTKSKTSAQGTSDETAHGRTLQQGKTYGFRLALQNPLYEPIQVRLMVQRPPANTSSASANTARTKRPPFVVSLPTSSFPIAPFAEAWEYDEDEDDGELNDDDIEDMLAGRANNNDHDTSSPSRQDPSARGGIGLLERRANITKVGGEVVIGRDGAGPVKVCLTILFRFGSHISLFTSRMLKLIICSLTCWLHIRIGPTTVTMNQTPLLPRVIEKQRLLQPSRSHFTYVSTWVPLRHHNPYCVFFSLHVICSSVHLLSSKFRGLHGVLVDLGYAATIEVPLLTVPIDSTVKMELAVTLALGAAVTVASVAAYY